MPRRFHREDPWREERGCSTNTDVLVGNAAFGKSDRARASGDQRSLETRTARTLSLSKTTSILEVRLPSRNSRSTGLVATSTMSSFIETMLSISSSKRLFFLLQVESAMIAKDLSRPAVSPPLGAPGGAGFVWSQPRRSRKKLEGGLPGGGKRGARAAKYKGCSLLGGQPHPGRPSDRWDPQCVPPLLWRHPSPPHVTCV